MRKSIAQNIGYPLQDFIRKTSLISTLDFLKESQYWDQERIDAYRTLKLRELIKYSSRNVPYYESLFRKIKLKSNDIISLKDIEKIPVLTKEIARKENYNLIARNSRLRHIKKGKTGGTTGAPLLILKDTANRSFTWASYYRWYEWMGLEFGDRTATLWGNSTVLKKSLGANTVKYFSNYLQNQIEINAFQLSEKDMLHIYKQLSNFKPLLLKGYLSAILKLAEFIEKNNYKGLFPLRLSTTSETLLQSHRTYLNNVFRTNVFDQYGCGELSAISYECMKHNGLHINQEHILLETLDNEDNPVIEKTGRIVGTDLDNHIMPFIRYENGDKATILNNKCTCGINQPLMTSIEGRIAHTLILENGSHVHGVFLTNIFYELEIFANRIERFQAIQPKPGEIILLLESKIDLEKSTLKILEKKLKKFFTKVEIKTVWEIPPEKTGKFQYIKNLSSKWPIS